MTRVVIALGSNMGDRLGHLRAAVEALGRAGVVVGARSGVWETAPVGPEQPDYLNAVVVAETALEPEVLLAELKRIEREAGRVVGERWGPRPLDLDILFFGDVVVDSEVLTVPHPRIGERAFVLAPLAEVVDGPLPVLGKRAAVLLERVGSEGVRRTGESL